MRSSWPRAYESAGFPSAPMRSRKHDCMFMEHKIVSIQPSCELVFVIPDLDPESIPAWIAACAGVTLPPLERLERSRGPGLATAQIRICNGGLIRMNDLEL